MHGLPVPQGALQPVVLLREHAYPAVQFGQFVGDPGLELAYLIRVDAAPAASKSCVRISCGVSRAGRPLR
ncbi:hypothetical protein AB0G03_02240 [Micromonospora aurantiaca]|uniref:hypothetical protein n=1 Tax=Micromonospora aurantiaca (nom. illeg.) TaxID=47850 RepID=UPI0033F4209D